MTVESRPRRERPRAFAEDWKTIGTPRPPTTVANPLGRVEPAAEPLTEQEVASARGVDHWGGIDLSPDGREVAFAWDREGSVEIYSAPLTGDRIIQLTDADARSVAPRWSPDGHWVAFVRGDAGNGSLRVVDRDGEHEHEVTADHRLHGAVTLSSEGIPVWSPRPALPALDVAGADQVRGSATLSPDGSMIAFATTVDGKSKIAFGHVRDGKVERIEVLGRGMPFDDSDPVWRPDGRGVLYRRREGGNVSVRRIFTVSHADEAVIDVPGWVFSPRVGPDSETVVAILVDRQGADIVLRPKGAIVIQRLTRQVPAAD
jgi:dipeptidyl aminopeptidase/acylaminoacyl peptidase